MEELIPTAYKCTQAEFYAIVKLAMQNYSLKLAKFTALKTKYDAAYGTAILTALGLAEAMPGVEARDFDAETFRGELITLNKNCTKKWNLLESYIKEVYIDAALKPALQAAGSKEYDKAVNKNWEHTVAMNVAAKGFMAVPANNTKLLGGGTNMPVGFEAAYNGDANLFALKYAAYTAATETTTATNAKTKANNDVYATTLDLLADGKTIGENDEDGAFVKLFTWADLKTIISPPKSASLELEAQDSVTLAPVADVTIVMKTEGGGQISLTADAVTGIAKSGNIDPGVYVGVAKAKGYNDLNFTKEVDKGTGAGKKLLMVKI